MLYLLASFVGLLLIWFIVSPYRAFRDIPGPPPSPLIGNWPALRKNYLLAHQGWVREYGPLSKYFVGRVPFILVGNFVLARQILVERFNDFTDRTPPIANARESHALVWIRGETWRKVRHILSPSFNSIQLKSNLPHINDAVDIFLKNMENLADTNKPFDMKTFIDSMALEIIATTTLGTHVPAQTEKNHPCVVACHEFFQSYDLYGPMTLLAHISPACMKYLVSIMRKHPPKAMKEQLRRLWALDSLVLPVIEERKKHPHTEIQDLVDIMITARNKDTNEGLSDIEIHHQCIILLHAGYETSANTLTFLFYLLSKSEEWDSKLVEEIITTFGTEPKFDDPEELKKSTPIMAKILNETWRMFAVVPTLWREATADVVEVGGHFFPRGTIFQIPSYAIHHDPKNFPDPETFNPDRFSEFNESLGMPRHVPFLPFGAGPRNCIGMKYAQMELKVAISKILSKYTFKLAPGLNKEPLDVVCGVTLGPKHGVMMTVNRRKPLE